MRKRPSPETRRVRARLAAALGLLYVLSVLSFWIAGIQAYLSGFEGVVRLLGFLYVPILALPLAGRGHVDGIAVHSPIWLWWFGVQAILAFATLWLYPYDRLHRPNRIRLVRRRREREPVSV